MPYFLALVALAIIFPSSFLFLLCAVPRKMSSFPTIVAASVIACSSILPSPLSLRTISRNVAYLIALIASRCLSIPSSSSSCATTASSVPLILLLVTISCHVLD